MSPAEVRHLPDQELVSMLTSLRPSDEAVAWLAAVITSPAAVEGVAELSRRYRATVQPERSTSAAGRFVGATTVSIDPDRWCSFFFRRRMPLNAVGPMFKRCEGWASVIKKKARAGYYALDDLATSLDMRVDDLIFQVGTDEERARLSACV